MMYTYFMTISSIGLISCAISIQAYVRTPEMIEAGIRQSDSAFVAEVEWYDTALISENVVEAAGRVHPNRLIWGSLPQAPVAVPRQKFYRFMRSGPNIWDSSMRSQEGARVPIIAFSSGTGDDTKVVYVIGDGRNPLPPAEELLAVRAFENRQDSSNLREELIQAVLSTQSSEVLWRYALRRLFLLENDPDRRFDLLLDSRLQAQAGVGRLYYAHALLTGNQCPDYEKCELPEDNPARIEIPYALAKAILLKLLNIFETSSSGDMAEAALLGFLGDPASKVGFTNQDWAQIRARIRAATEKPEHPLHAPAPSRQAHVTKLLETVMKEPNPFAP